MVTTRDPLSPAEIKTLQLQFAAFPWIQRFIFLVAARQKPPAIGFLRELQEMVKVNQALVDEVRRSNARQNLKEYNNESDNSFRRSAKTF